jgi:3-oxoacyl-[acyl-carrier-protein] synthase-3
MKMEGREVFKETIKRMCSIADDVLQRNDLTIDDIAYGIPHQAKMRIISTISDRMKIQKNVYQFTASGQYISSFDTDYD